MNNLIPDDTFLPAPNNQINIDSIFYIQRDIRRKALYTLNEQGALLKIIGRKKFGKTNFLHQIIHYCNNELFFDFIFFDLKSFNPHTIKDYDSLIIHLLFGISKSIKPYNNPIEIKKLWEKFDILDVNSRFFRIIENYLLKKIANLVIIIDDIDLMFNDSTIAIQFYSLLREIHQLGSAREIQKWGKIRVVISYAVAKYKTLIDPNISPFNVGEPLILNEFSKNQVQSLALAHKFNLTEEDIKEIREYIGFQPYLIRIFFYEYYSNQDKNIREVLYNQGIYDSFLSKLWDIFEKINKRDEVENLLEDFEKKEMLLSTGILKNEGSEFKYSCGLYNEYFTKCLKL